MGAPHHKLLSRPREGHKTSLAKGGAQSAVGLDQGEMASGTLTHDVRRAVGKGLTRRAAEARYARLFESLRNPAKGMVRKAFGSAFSEDELEDIYSSAWLSTLGALERRPRKLADDELRRYLMTAVANHAGREMRRRGRKPTISLESVAETSAWSDSPDEAAAHAERADIAREILGSLPERRRAVLVFRYGWDLEPSEICSLVEGLSPRAYRKEIERGVAEVAKKMRLVDDGGWCETREPLLRAVVAGTADDDEKRQAQRHLSNCRSCATFVGKLNGHLHELGGVMAIEGLAERAGIDASSFADRGVAVIDRAKNAISSVFSRSSETVDNAAGQVIASGGTRGAGAAGAGALAKVAGLGAAPKLIAACVGTGAAATACVAAGVLPGLDREREPGRPAVKEVRDVDPGLRETSRHASLTLIDETPATAADPPSPDPAPSPPPDPAPQPPAPEPTPAPASASAATPAEPPPTVQEFEPVGVPIGGSISPASNSSSSGGGTATGGSNDFGP